MDQISNIGIGALYPIRLEKNSKGQTGWYPSYGDPKLIENNLRAILTYDIGFRLRQEDFGNRLNQCLEEPNTIALDYMIQRFIIEAIASYENRIRLNNIKSTHENHSLSILIDYHIISINKDSSVLINYNL